MSSAGKVMLISIHVLREEDDQIQATNSGK